MSESEWTQVIGDVPVADGRARCVEWLEAHGVAETDRDSVVRVEVVRTEQGDVIRLLVRSDYLRETTGDDSQAAPE
jgi:hypothetical protein